MNDIEVALLVVVAGCLVFFLMPVIMTGISMIDLEMAILIALIVPLVVILPPVTVACYKTFVALLEEIGKQ